MARRIAAAELALITVLLAVVAIPLGLLISAQDRRDFHAGTATAAATVANVAEERLDDGVNGPALGRSIREMGRQGDQLAVTGAPAPPPSRAKASSGPSMTRRAG